MDGIAQVVRRLFPLERGIFEDKVGNIWFCLDVIFKFRRPPNPVPHATLAWLSLALTSMLLVPIAVQLLSRRNEHYTCRRLLLAMQCSALAFYLASFQVHEKGILMAVVPASMLWVEDAAFVTWFNVVSCFSMYPLLARDGLALVYYVALSILLVQLLLRAVFSFSRDPWHQKSILIGAFLIVHWHLCAESLPPHPSRPDIWPVTNALMSCAFFVGIYLRQIANLWGIVLGGGRDTSKHPS